MNNLACQARAIINSKLLSDHELQDINLKQHQEAADKQSLSESELEPVLMGSLPTRQTSADVILQPVLVDGKSSEFGQLLSCVEECLSDVSVTEELKVVFDQLRSCLLEIDTLDFDERQALPKLIDNKISKKWLCMMNKCLDKCVQKQVISVSQCDCLVYAGAMAVNRLSGQHVAKSRRTGRSDAWKIRLESQIKQFRKHHYMIELKQMNFKCLN